MWPRYGDIRVVFIDLLNDPKILSSGASTDSLVISPASLKDIIFQGDDGFYTFDFSVIDPPLM